jgi:glycosyltransferase involved in cell wall biosynthesis
LRLLITTNPDQGHIAARAAQPPPAIQYVPNGIAVTGHAGGAAPQHLRARYGLPTECEIVASVGRLATEKRHDVFLRACSTIAQSRPRTHFIIAGIGPKRAGLERLARDFGIHDRVHFARLVDDIPALLSVVTVLMHTSDAEGTPRAVLEAMAAGVPVVATAVGGVPDLVENGRTGVLVPRRAPSALADATVRLLSDVDARERMGALARRRVESLFSAAIMAERTEALYRRHALDGAWVTS